MRMGEICTNNSPTKKMEQNKQEKTKTKKIKQLPIRTFVVRDSLLTTLCENPHIKVIKNIFAASLIALFLNTVLHDYFEHGEFRVGFKVISSGLGKIYWVALIWVSLNLCALFVHQCFNFWGTRRAQFPPKDKTIRTWDVVWLLALGVYYILQFRVIAILVYALELPIGSASIICLEQTRLLMKIHAYVRSNAGKVLNYKPHSDQQLILPTLQHFVYFLFAPTLVYCDEYPKRKTIRWKFVFEKLVEVVGVVFYYAFLLERFIIPNHKEIGLRPYTIQELILQALDNFTVGLMLLLLAFYVVLDTTQNLFGELLKFGDRQFYQDWWTSTGYNEYFRTWNMVVGDWLFTYVYKDVYEYVVPGNKRMAKLTVFVVSAIVHEWVLTTMFGFFFPVLFVAFCEAGILSFIPAPKLDVLNILFWFFLAIGCSFLSSLYTTEWFVRNNLPIVDGSGFLDFIVPRLFTCNCIVY